LFSPALVISPGTKKVVGAASQLRLARRHEREADGGAVVGPDTATCSARLAGDGIVSMAWDIVKGTYRQP
jgi:hypothetical protein